MSGTSSSGLGRGLEALFADVVAEVPASQKRLDTSKDRRANERIIYVPIECIEPNPSQPRRFFDETKLTELAASIRQNGLIQPIIVSKIDKEEDRYKIVAGERRWRAAQLCGLIEIPCILRELSEQEAYLIAVIENVQRADLDPIEEAEGYQSLIEKFAYSQEQVSEYVGKSRPHVANTLRLLTCTETIKSFLREGKLSAGHARALLSAPDPDRLAEKAVQAGWTVRQTEKQAKDMKAEGSSSTLMASQRKSADIARLEGQLSLILKCAVSIQSKENGSGHIKISFVGGDEFETLVDHLRDFGQRTMAS